MAGSSTYPTAPDNFNVNNFDSNPQRLLGPDLDNARAAINAIEAELGTDPSGTDTTVAVAIAAARKYHDTHTIALMGNVNIPVGQTDYIPPFFVSLPTGRTAVIKKVRFRINTGTSATAKLQKNGVDIPEYSGANALTITTAAAEIAPGSPPAVANNDIIALVVTAVTGAPQNLSASIVVEAS